MTMRPIALLLTCLAATFVASGDDIAKRAVAAYDIGNFAEAERLELEALKQFEATHPPDHASIATSLHNLGVLARTRGDLKQAERYLSRVLDIRASQPWARAEYASTLIEVANLWQIRKKPYLAEPPLREAIEILEGNPQGNQVALSAAYNTLGSLHITLGDPDGAERHLRNALRYSGHAPPAHIMTVKANLAAAIFDQGRVSEGLALYRDTMAQAHAALGEAHPRYHDVVRFYARALRNAKRGGEAKALVRSLVQ